MVFGRNKATGTPMWATMSTKPYSTVPICNLTNRIDVASYSLRARGFLNITWYSDYPSWGAGSHLGSFSKNTYSHGSDAETAALGLGLSQASGNVIHTGDPLNQAISFLSRMKLRPSRISPLLPPPRVRGIGKAYTCHSQTTSRK